MEAVLPEARRRGVRIITNMGAANSPAAAECVRRVAARLGVRGFTIAVVTGDDVRALAGDWFSPAGTGEALDAADMVSANAYLGAEPIAEALQGGADLVITGRVADP